MQSVTAIYRQTHSLYGALQFLIMLNCIKKSVAAAYRNGLFDYFATKPTFL